MAQCMAWELEREFLQVVLVPYNDRGNCIRAAQSTNPAWYQELCRRYPKQRTKPRRRQKPDTAIKRAHVKRALAELAGGRCETEYAKRLLPLVEKEFKELVGTPSH